MPSINDLINKASIEESFDNMKSIDIIKTVGLQTINDNFGISAADFKSNEALLTWLIIDDSSYILEFNGEAAVCDGQNIFVNELTQFSGRKDILVGQSLLNQDKPIHPFLTVDNIVKLNNKNYKACGATPLYRKCCEILSTMALKAKVDFADNGFPCRCILAIVTDGGNYERYASGKTFGPDDVKTLIDELGEGLIVYFMGIEGNTRVNFKKIAMDMGIHDKNIIISKSSPDEIKSAFRSISKSISSASKSSRVFSEVSTTGGFLD